ncbi:MAG: hypothetical protein FJZ04_04375 [Candidatus Moranbacteria bacterium]|nr:hypothetical protein [Candidatus Moranbacteria bacterium]
MRITERLALPTAQSLEQRPRLESPASNAVALLYSGGADSTYSACVLAQNFKTVYLMTYERLGFFGSRRVLAHTKRLKERFPQTRFIQKFINYEKYYKNLTYENYFSGLEDHGFLPLATCGFCKTAMHWRNLIFCLENGIKYAADGATFDSVEYVEQNPRILMPEIKRMYAHFGITHLNPVFQEGLSTERELYRLKIIDHQKIKRTKHENQIYCTQHILYAMVLRVYLRKHSFSEFEKMMKRYFKQKVGYIISETEKYNLSSP